MLNLLTLLPMTKYRLLTQDGYPWATLRANGIYAEDFIPYGTMTIKQIASAWPDDWRLMDDVDELELFKKKAKELGYSLVKEEPSNKWVVAGNKYLYQDDYLRIEDNEDKESVYIQEKDLDEVIEKIQSIRKL